MTETPSVTEIQEQIVNDYETELGQTVPVLPVAFIRVLAFAIAGVMFLVYKFGLWIYRQISASTADEEQLNLIGSGYNIERIPAVKAQIELNVSDSVNGSFVLAGSLLTFQGNTYSVLETAEVSGGVAEFVVEALEAGAASNADDGSIFKFVYILPGVNSDAVVVGTETTGEDQETVEAYRDRILIRQGTPPQGGAAPDWILWTREVPGVVKVVTERVAPGDIVVYPLVGLTYDDRLPTYDKLQEITEYISDPVRRPLNCETAEAVLMEEVFFNVTITDLLPDSPAMQNLIIEALEAFFLDRFPREYEEEANPKDIISKLEIYALCKSVGATSANIVIDVLYGDSDIDAYQLERNEVAHVGDITFV